MHEPKQHNVGESIETIINSDAVTEPTKQVLNERLAREATARPRFFDDETFSILQAVCDRLVPQEDKLRKVDIAGTLDQNLSQNKGRGWRYDVMKPTGEAFKEGLHLIDQMAQRQSRLAFNKLTVTAQQQMLRGIAERNEDSAIDRFFEELLAAVTEIYYSHPYAKEAIGDLSFADAHGWKL